MRMWFVNIVVFLILTVTAYAKFPLSGERFLSCLLDYTIVIYIIKKIGFNHTFQHSIVKTYIIISIATLVGVLIRFFAEYGDNFANEAFSAKNLFIFMLVIPIYSVVVYTAVRK